MFYVIYAITEIALWATAGYLYFADVSVIGAIITAVVAAIGLIPVCGEAIFEIIGEILSG